MSEVCCEHASVCVCEFDRVAAAIDAAEAIAWDRIGGPNAADADGIKQLKTRLAHLRPSTMDGWHWVARRLARAIENGWCEEAVTSLLRLAT